MSHGFDALQWDGPGDRWMNKNGSLLPAERTVQLPDSKVIDLDAVPPMRMVAPPHHLLALMDDESIGAESFRSLAIRLKSFRKRRQLKKLLVTSSIKGEGKSVISANLALTLATQERVLLIDGDLHQAGLREVLGSRGQSGLADWWTSSAPVTNFLTRMEGFFLWYLPAGEAEEDPLEILQSPKFAETLNQIVTWFDWVIIDSPPLVPIPDSSLWATHVDGTLLIVRQGTTPKALLKKALETEHLKLLGIITNEWEEMHQQYYGRYYGYGRRTNRLAARHKSHLSEPKNISLPSSTSRPL